MPLGAFLLFCLQFFGSTHSSTKLKLDLWICYLNPERNWSENVVFGSAGLVYGEYAAGVFIYIYIFD